MNRRTFLATGAAVSIAGCLGGDGGASPTATEMMDETASPTPSGERLENHAAGADLEAQPTLGPDPFEAEATIIAFEDPSCPRCAAFERNTVPKINSELVETGRGAFVFRGYPVIYPWGKPATQALEATYARDADAFWALAAHYFENQSSFGGDNVLDKTRTFIADNTEIDADAVVADAEAKAYDEQVQLDLDAGEQAGAGRTTPSVYLFKNGRYRTKAAGSVSYSVIKNALGV